MNATGLSPLRYLLRTMRDAFSGLEIKVVEQAAEDDRVYSTLLVTGIQNGVFDGVVGQGQPVRLTVLDAVHLKDGKVIERTACSTRSRTRSSPSASRPPWPAVSPPAPAGLRLHGRGRQSTTRVA